MLGQVMSGDSELASQKASYTCARSPYGMCTCHVTQVRGMALATAASAPTLRQLVLGTAQSKALDVCCRADCGSGASSGFLLLGTMLDRSSHASSALSLDTTVFVSSAARPRDDGPANVEMVLNAVRSVRALGLNRSRCVVVFDGLGAKPGVTPRMRERYASKIRRVREIMADVDVLVQEDWLHKANSLRCAMQAVPRTGFVFQIEDDTIVEVCATPTATGRCELSCHCRVCFSSTAHHTLPSADEMVRSTLGPSAMRFAGVRNLCGST